MYISRNAMKTLAVIIGAAIISGTGYGIAHYNLLPQSSLGQQDEFASWDWETLASPSNTPRPRDKREAKESEESAHNLEALRLVSRAMLLVQENYVEPDRVQPRKMLLGALDFIEKRIPEVLVDDTDAEDTNVVALTVNRATTTIELGNLNNVWDITPRLKDAFAFIQENLVTTEDTRQIEYAAINGMLANLDPHSNLLDPDQYSDMKMHTRGEFGGLGFVVSMREGRLTVMRIIPNTPAHRGGVQARDIITRIEDDSTMNMDLNHAVSRLRGKPGTPITFIVERAGLDEPKKFTLTRAIIEIDSIDPVVLLEDSVGYIRITNFQGHTTRDLKKALEDLQKQAEGDMNGLILDLRGNPGGLLEQAIQVADLFISRGTIVSTVGMNNRLRERKTASRSGTFSDLPLIVLVNNTSASASEIVAGAVRNLDRGLVLGSPTFGKGSVQVLYDLVDDSALKLTIAQYLTPGDVSIQDKGIVPDLELLPALVSKNRLMAFAPRLTITESDLEDPFGLTGREGTPSPISLDPFRTVAPEQQDGDDQPIPNITFLRDDVPEDEEIDEFEEPDWKPDFHVELSRLVLAKSGAPTRRAMFQRARPVLDERRQAERQRIYDAISELGVDWTPPPEDAPRTSAEEHRIDASIEFDGSDTAGEETRIVLTVTNGNKHTLHRVRAWTESKTPRTIRYSLLFNRLEFLFGKLEPGETRTWSLPLELPNDIRARRELLDIIIEAEGTGTLPPINSYVDIQELPRPAFAFSWQVSGSADGPGDGRLVAGKSNNLDVFVRNIGEGRSTDAVVTIQNYDDQPVDITMGRHRIGELSSQETARVTMAMDLREGFPEDTQRLRVTILDREMVQYLSDEIHIPVTKQALEVSATSGIVRLNEDASILSWANEGAPVIANAEQNAILPVDGRVGDMHRVRWDDGKVGFIPDAKVRRLPRSRRTQSGEITPLFPHSPPRIILNEDMTAHITNSENILLSGSVKATDELRDMYIFVNNDKVYFRAWDDTAEAVEAADRTLPSSHIEGGVEPSNPEESASEARVKLLEIPFETRIALEKGANNIVIVGRKTEQLQSREQIIIFRSSDSPESDQPSVDATRPSSDEE